MLMPHTASDERWPQLAPRAGAVFFDTDAKRYPFLDHELRRPKGAGFDRSRAHST